MRKLTITGLILGVAIGLFAAMPVFAETSSGCLGLDTLVGTANPTLAIGADTFLAGDVVKVTVTGAGTDFSLFSGGATVGGPELIGGTLTYEIPTDGDYDFEVQVTGLTDVTTEAAFTCTPVEEEEEEGDGKVTLCHIPPGNPDAAHTISVGAPAKAAHLGHGDTEGACGDAESEHTDGDSGLAIFTLDESGIIEIWGNCDGANCQLLLTIDIYALNLGGNDSGSDDSDQDDNGSVVDDGFAEGWVVIIYFLHLDPDDPTLSVYQINIYNQGELVNDDILLFINADGDIDSWATHSIWDERAVEAGLTE